MSRTATRRPRRNDEATRSPAMRAYREMLAHTVKQHLIDHNLTQSEAAFVMQDAASQVSLVVTGNLRGFSTERLLRMVQRLGYDLTTEARPSTRGSGSLQFRVIRRGRARA